MSVGNAVRAVSVFFKNMSIYPGLFGLLDKAANRILDSDADQIAHIIAQPMTHDDVDRVMAILDPYLDEPATA